MTNGNEHFAYIEGEGWARVIETFDGTPVAYGPIYSRLTDLLHDMGDHQRCICTL